MLPIQRGPRPSAGAERGFTLLEVVVSMLIIGLLVGVLSSGLVTTMRVSSESNNLARANVLLTSFEETLQQIDYRPCTDGDLVSIYSQAFTEYEMGLPPGERVVSPSNGVTATIVSVDTGGGCVGGAADSGEQTLEIQLTYRDVTRSGNMVKRSDAPAAGPVADFDWELRSGPGDPLGIVWLDAGKSTPRASLIEYRWECGDTAATEFVVATHDDPSVLCTYNATASAETYDVTLTVTDVEGLTNSRTKTVTIPAATDPRLPPAAIITASCPSAPCTAGNAPLTVNFDGSASNSLEGTVVSYEWDFGDPLSGAANTSTAAAPSHVFTRDKVFTIRLTVTDEIGLTGSATVAIDVDNPGPVPPTASFTMSPVPTVAPQNVTFNGTASKDAGNNPVASYLWDFGDGTTAPGAAPVHLYNAPGDYTVTLTVTDGGGVTATTSQLLHVDAWAPPPPDFRMTDAAGELAHDGHFYFAWTNQPASAGDIVEYQIEVSGYIGCIAFGTKYRTVTANAPGTIQTYDFRVSWPFSNVCLGSQYKWRVRSHRISPTNGETWTPWGPYSYWLISHT